MIRLPRLVAVSLVAAATERVVRAEDVFTRDTALASAPLDPEADVCAGDLPGSACADEAELHNHVLLLQGRLRNKGKRRAALGASGHSVGDNPEGERAEPNVSDSVPVDVSTDGNITPFEGRMAKDAACTDEPGWANGYDCRVDGRNEQDGCSTEGWTCAAYEKHGWCRGGKPAAGDWAFGMKLKYPEENCCVCGKRPVASCVQYGCMGSYNPYAKCQCTPECEEHENCCSDYKVHCGAGGPAPTPGAANCKDGHDFCAKWASTGECERNPHWMHDNCMMSCNMCPSGSTPRPTPAPVNVICKDSSEHCSSWAADGECARNPSFMHDSCMKSCHMCEDSTPTLAPTLSPTPAPTAPPPKPDADCKDTSASCDYWASTGECKKTASWMEQNCRKACGLCGGATTTTTTIAAPCQDLHSDCGSWAGQGECQRNPSWMDINCRAACGYCTGSGPSPGPVKDVPVFHGFAYGPSPMLKVGTLPNDDFMMEGAELLWGPTGRHDLAVMGALGANVVRLYGNDPQWDHRKFLDEANRNNLRVIVGISDWPYKQMPDPPNCAATGFNCFSQIYDSYKANLENGFLTPDKTGYHHALEAVIVMNEPELKFLQRPIDDPQTITERCRMLASAWDAMLQVERDLGVTKDLVRFTITWSFAQLGSRPPGIGQMESFWECVQDVPKAGYTPKNDLKAAFLSRWVNSFNTQTWASILRGLFFEKYQKSSFWKGALKVPVFIGEYHSLNDEAADLSDDLKTISAYAEEFPFFKGFAFFEFSVRYDKGPHDRQDEFGMFGFGDTEIAPFEYFGTQYSIRCLKQMPDGSGNSMMEAFQGRYADAPSKEQTDALQKALCV